MSLPDNVKNSLSKSTHEFLPGSYGHLSGIRHYYESSSQYASDSVEPGSIEDLAAIMKFLKSRESGSVPFAVKGGGHTSNPGFSSTPGILISMSRFNEMVFHPPSGTEQALLTVGAGCLFDEVYRFIRKKNYNIVGGGGGVGVGGWIMGGGYSLKTNQYGLGIDNLVRVDIVLPDGTIKLGVSERNESDLFWAIKGGGNNFGIVTKFVLKAYPQGTGGMVYGGVLVFDESRVRRVKQAIVKFVDSYEDDKAAIVAAFRFYRNHGIQEFKVTVLAFYDSEKPADPTLFQRFLAIPHKGELVESPYIRIDNAQTLLAGPIPLDNVVEILHASDQGWSPSSLPPPPTVAPSLNVRARWGNVMVFKYTANLVDAIEEEAKAASLLMNKHNGRMVVADIWPFRQNMFKRSTTSAWPHVEEKPNAFTVIYFTWEDEKNDEVWVEQMKTALKHIHDVAVEEKCTWDGAPVYLNTALEDVTTIPQIYRDHLIYLSELRRKYDPDGVMARTGGFRIPNDILVHHSDLIIANARNNDTIGVRENSNDITVVETGSRFKITRVPTGAEKYTIAIGDRYATLDPNEGKLVLRNQASDSWKIIPKVQVRETRKWIYSIVTLDETKRWALVGQQVKCIGVEDIGDGHTALWYMES